MDISEDTEGPASKANEWYNELRRDVMVATLLDPCLLAYQAIAEDTTTSALASKNVDAIAVIPVRTNM